MTPGSHGGMWATTKVDAAAPRSKDASLLKYLRERSDGLPCALLMMRADRAVALRSFCSLLAACLLVLVMLTPAAAQVPPAEMIGAGPVVAPSASTGMRRIYHQPLGTAFEPILDVGAFACP